MVALWALLWLTWDCAMVWSWSFGIPSAIGVPGDSARNFYAVTHPLTAIICWIIAALWTLQWSRSNWILAVPVLFVMLGFAFESVSYIDTETWMMPDRPSTLWQWITILTGTAFLYAWLFTPKGLNTACTILMAGFVLGMLGAFQDYVCGAQPPFLQGSVCGGGAGEQYVRYAITAFVIATLATLGLAVARRLRW